MGNQYNETKVILHVHVYNYFILYNYCLIFVFFQILQEEGQFIVTFPYGYHCGFNQGLNCAESTNFASLRWIDFGKKATRCTCNNDMVKINMDVFVEKFQPDQWDSYRQERDSKLTPVKKTPPAQSRWEGVNIVCGRSLLVHLVQIFF